MLNDSGFLGRYKDFVEKYDPEFYEAVKNIKNLNVFPGTNPDVTEEQVFKELVRVGKRLGEARERGEVLTSFPRSKKEPVDVYKFIEGLDSVTE